MELPADQINPLHLHELPQQQLQQPPIQVPAPGHDLSPLFQLNPQGSIKFLIRCITSGIYIGGITLIPTCCILYATRDSKLLVDAVLRYYHIIRCVIYIVQLPLRIVLLNRLKIAAAQPNRIAIIDKLCELTRSRAWNYNHLIGQLVYVSLAFSCSFMLNSKLSFLSNIHATTQTAVEFTTLILYRLLVMNVFTFFTHMSISFVWMNHIFADQWFDFQSASKGADIQTINKLTKIVKYQNIQNINDPIDNTTTPTASTTTTDTTHAIIEDSCIICFNDYLPSDDIRVLQCKHCYHVDCIDVWLKSKSHCPLCSTSINKKLN